MRAFAFFTPGKSGHCKPLFTNFTGSSASPEEDDPCREATDCVCVGGVRVFTRVHVRVRVGVCTCMCGHGCGCVVCVRSCAHVCVCVRACVRGTVCGCAGVPACVGWLACVHVRACVPPPPPLHRGEEDGLRPEAPRSSTCFTTTGPLHGTRTIGSAWLSCATCRSGLFVRVFLCRALVLGKNREMQECAKGLPGGALSSCLPRASRIS